MTAKNNVNTMEYYDVAFFARITLDNLILLISAYTGVDKDSVVSDEDFEIIIENRKISIGVEVRYQEQDFQTWITMTCLNYKFNNIQLVKFAIMMAKKLNTEVAIEDPLWEGEPQVSSRMIISPAQTYYRAYFYQDDRCVCTMNSYEKERNNTSQVIQKLEVGS
jgi:hypothetical protein